MLTRSVFPVLRHIQAWRNRGRSLIRFQAWRSPDLALSRFQPSRNGCRKVKSSRIEERARFSNGKGKNFVRTTICMTSLERKRIMLSWRLCSSLKIIWSAIWFGPKRLENATCWRCSLWNWDTAPTRRMESLSSTSIVWSNSKGKRVSQVKNMKLRNRAFQKRSRKVIAKKLKNYEEFAVQKLINLEKWNMTSSLHKKEENPSTVNQFMVQIQKLQDKANSLTDAKEFDDLETASSTGLSTFTVNPWYSESQRNDKPRFTRNSLGTSGNVVVGLLVRSEPSAAPFDNSKNLGLSSCRLRPTATGKIAEQRDPHFGRTLSTWNRPYRTGGTGSKKNIMDNPRNQVSDLHFDKFPVSCSNSGWIKEGRVVKSTDDLMTSRPFEGRDFPDLELIDSKIASA